MNPRLAAVRQLRDCGVVRTRFHHAEFVALMEGGIAEPAIVADDERGLDWRLTEKGRGLAAVVLNKGIGS